MRRTATYIILAAALSAVLAGAALAGKYGKRIGVERASGDYAAAVASGTARKPRRIYVEVRSTPRQRVSGAWSVTCSKGTGAGSKSGEFTGRARKAKRIKLPMSRPDVCYVGASAQLDEGGKLKVSIFKR